MAAMQEQKAVNIEYIHHLTYRMEDLRIKGVLCDTTVVTSDLELSAHSIVLAAASPVFEAALANFPKMTTSYRLEMVGIDGTIMTNILQLIYTGKSENERFSANDNTIFFDACKQLGLGVVIPEHMDDHQQAVNSEDGHINACALEAQDTDICTVLNSCEASDSILPSQNDFVVLNADTYNNNNYSTTHAVSKFEQDIDSYPPDIRDLLMPLHGVTPTSEVLDCNRSISLPRCNGSAVEMEVNLQVPESADPAVVKQEQNTYDNSSTMADELLQLYDCYGICQMSNAEPAVVRRGRPPGPSFSDPADPRVWRHDCPQCNRRFKYASHLRSHQERLHSEYGLASTLCHRRFNEEYLDNHTLSHAVERPNVCTECGRSFLRSSDLVSHAHTHSGKRLFACEQCDRPFAKKADLLRHYRVHSGERPYVCETCGKAFKILFHLKLHACVHVAARTHQCMTCPKAFSNMTRLRKHMFIHSGIRPHECSVCERRFSRPSNLRAHMKVHESRYAALALDFNVDSRACIEGGEGEGEGEEGEGEGGEGEGGEEGEGELELANCGVEIDAHGVLVTLPYGLVDDLTNVTDCDATNAVLNRQELPLN